MIYKDGSNYTNKTNINCYHIVQFGTELEGGTFWCFNERTNARSFYCYCKYENYSDTDARPNAQKEGYRRPDVPRTLLVHSHACQA